MLPASANDERRRAVSQPPKAVLRFGELDVDLEREAVKLDGELVH